VPGELGGLLVMRADLAGGGVAGQRPDLEQRPGGGRAVQVAVGDDGAVMGAAGSAVRGVLLPVAENSDEGGADDADVGVQ